MRALLAFAVSLALLLPEGHQACAIPSTTTGSANTTCACAPSPVIPLPYQAARFASIVVTPSTADGTSTFVPVVTGQSAFGAATSPFETISTINGTIILEHAKPGKLAAASVTWSNSAGTSVFVGTSAALALPDGLSGGSATRGYGVNPAASSGSAEPVFGDGASGASYIPNGVKEPNRRESDLTIEGFAIAGPAPDRFSAASLTAGAVVPTGGTLLVPITVVGTGPGDLTFNLTIFANEGTVLGGAGEAFDYLLDPMVTNGLLTTVAEPASLAVLGVGLVGLASVHGRRKRWSRRDGMTG